MNTYRYRIKSTLVNKIDRNDGQRKKMESGGGSRGREEIEKAAGGEDQPSGY